jgi:signal transduction histidine kinase
MESTGFAIKKEEVDLVEICDSILTELAGRILEKKTIIIKHYGIAIPHLNIGKKAATIIFQNLLTNAIKYTPEGGTVEIKIDTIVKGVLISVKDNGYGIPEAAKSRIFSKLFRADNVREKEPTGTGLGLYLLKSLVDKIGGKVWFESKEGEGSTFYVELK